MQYDESSYGNGVMTESLVAIPSRNGPYFTRGKEYHILRHHAWVYIILCDKGHERVISMESGARSAHLPPPYDPQRYSFSSDHLGTFEIKKSS